MISTKALKLNNPASRLRASSGSKIMLVEDHSVNRELLSDYLILCGYEVLSLVDGREFFPAIADFKPDLILLDLKLPAPDGFTLLKQMQENSYWSHIPVIVISAFAFQGDQQRAMNLGARRYLTKPVHLHHLQEAIDEELQCIAA